MVGEKMWVFIVRGGVGVVDWAAMVALWIDWGSLNWGC